MPPKKDSKKEVNLSSQLNYCQQLLSEDDGTGMNKNIVQFSLKFQIQHSNNIENLVVIFEWFNQQAQPERFDTGLLDTWQNVDENPQNIQFEKVFDPIRLDEPICKLLCSKSFYIYIVNAEDMKVQQEILLDYSQLLITPQFKYANTKLKVLPIESFKFSITPDKELLQPIFRNYLNPFEIEIIGAKDLPIMNDRKYEPVYVVYTFFDGQRIKSHQVIHDRTIRWGSKHVFLLGYLDPHKLKEQLKNKLFLVEVHNRDELLDNNIRKELDLFNIEQWVKIEEEKEKPPEPVDEKGKKGGKKEEPKKEAAPPKKDAKKDTKKKEVKLVGEPIKDPEPNLEYNRNNYGVAVFYLCDLLKPHVRQLKLQAPIIPRKKYEDLESNNLDLNTTAKKNLPKLFSSSNYLDSSAFLLIGLNIAFGIGEFKRPIIEKPPSQQDAKKPQLKEQQQQQLRPPSQEQHQQIQDLPAIFERAVFIAPYKSKEFVQKLQQAYYDINMECFKIEEGGLRGLRTKALSDEEKRSRELDYLDGFEVIDNEFRLFVIEGIGSKAMKRLGELVPRLEPNSDVFKILKNPDVLFKERVYTLFNVEIKRIRLRENLSKLLLNPDLYIRTKVPENVQETLVKISHILKHHNVRTVSEFDLFPLASDLIAVERKYSDSLTDEDIYGQDQTMRKAKKVKGTQDLNSFTESKLNTTVKLQDSLQMNSQSGVGTNIGPGISTSVGKEIKIQQDEQDAQKLQPLKKIKNSQDTYKLQMKNYKGEALGTSIYSGTKNNDYEQQLHELRKRIQQDKNNFYTYSQDFLSLSIDPVDVIEKQKQEKEENVKEQLEQINGREKFKTVQARAKQEFTLHPKKPPKDILDDIAENPWYKQNKLKEEILKPAKELKAFKHSEKEEFNPYIGRIGVFSNPEIREEEKISPAEREREQREQKKKEQESFLKQCIGDTYFYTKARTFEKCDQIDKNQGLLEDIAVKKGLMVTNTQIKNSNIELQRRVNHPPSSIFHNEIYSQAVDPFTRKLDVNKATSDQMFDYYQEPEILTKTLIHKPLRQVPY